MILKTEHLKIISINKKNYKQFKKQSNDWPTGIVDLIINHDLKRYRNDQLMEWSVWVITDKITGEIIGDAGFKDIPDFRGAVDLGYSILTSYRRKGYCFEATKALIDYAFTKGTVEEVLADCRKDNIGSVKVLEKHGFIKISEDETSYYWSNKPLI